MAMRTHGGLEEGCIVAMKVDPLGKATWKSNLQRQAEYENAEWIEGEISLPSSLS